MADKKHIAIVNKIDAKQIAKFDLLLISAVIRNLIANAIKFTPENGTISIESVRNQSETIVSVTDTGVGITQERIEKLFDETSFETTFGTNKEKGSGLGLKVCKYFVEQHGGNIWVESKIGQGSIFKFNLQG